MQYEKSKKLALIDELNCSIQLIKVGFGEYQNLSLANDFYHLPFQLISSGFERLMKCYICLGYYEKKNDFPDPKLFKHKLGHDLTKLKEYIQTEFFQENSQALSEDLLFIKSDENLQSLLYLLSEFGKFARYFNLNVITGENNPGINVKKEWENFEDDFIKNDKALLEKLSNIESTEEVIQATTQKTIAILERFIRALARQFTLGKLGTLAQQLSPCVDDFLRMKDLDFSTIDYRKTTAGFQKEELKPHKRTFKDEFGRKTNKEFKSQNLRKTDYDGDWPFYSKEVIIKCRQKHYCIVTINGYDYALNGAAKGKYKINNVHDAGMAILGKSISPFITLALQLGEK